MKETLVPAVVVSEVARRHGASRSLLFTWRRQSRAEARSESAGSILLPVEIESPAMTTSDVLREDQSNASSVPLHPAHLGGAKTVGDVRVCEVRSPPAAEPAAERYALERAPIALSTVADALGTVCAALDLLRRLVEAHVTAAERLHGTTRPFPCRRRARTIPGDFGRIYGRSPLRKGFPLVPANRRCSYPSSHMARSHGP